MSAKLPRSPIQHITDCKGGETERRLESIANDEFHNWANYGFAVIDESEVEDKDEIADV